MPEKVVAAGLVLPQLTRRVAEEHLEELTKLIETAGGSVVSTVLAKRNGPDPATFVGSGKAEEIGDIAKSNGATLVVFDDDLSPAQTRNLEKAIGTKVIDRSALILDIFARRARSREARTQVELAQLEYLLPRLTRAWSHLSRQAGGIGTRGVGETQLEIDRRIVRTRIARLKDELTKIEGIRQTQRKGREAVYTVALVGYTNAGKSTLFNRLTRGGAEAVDKLFATLDSKSHRIAFDMPRDTVVIDTVGFIRKLPHHLVASFRSTMEEAVEADLVLHIVDGSHPQWAEQREVGDQVLADLGIDNDRIMEVFNKTDQLGEDELDARLPRKSIAVSALNGNGVEDLLRAIDERQRAGGSVMRLEVPHGEGRVVAKLHELAQVYRQTVTDDATIFTVWIPNDAVHLFEAYSSAEQPGRASVRVSRTA